MQGRILVLFVLLAVTPMTGWSQSTLNFPRFFPAAELSNTGVAIANPGPTTASVTFRLYAQNGAVLATSYRDYLPASQSARSGLEIFPGAAGLGGWIQATSPVTGLQGFWLNYEGTLSLFLDGAEAAAVFAEQVIPLVAGRTEINIANPNPTSVSATIRVYGQAGSELAASVTRAIGGNGVIQEQVAAMFALTPDTAALARYLKISVASLTPVAATAVIHDYLTSGTETGVINGANAASAVLEADFPHVINGNAGVDYVTDVGVTNLSSAPQTVTITLTPLTTNGSGVEVAGAAIQRQRTLPGNGALREAARTLFDLPETFVNGWVRILGTAPLTGFAAYAGGGAVAVVPAQAAPEMNLIFPHIANQRGVWTTGIALLNAGSSPASVDVFAMRPNGTLIGGADNEPKARFTLAAGTKTSKNLGELIPAADLRPAGEDGGFVFVRSDVPLFGIELFYTTGVKILSNVAAGKLLPGVTFSVPDPTQPLTLTAVSPHRVARGTALTVSGSGFSPTPANNIVIFTTAENGGTVEMAATSSSPTSMTVTVPSTAASGAVRIRVNGETASGSDTIIDVTATSSSLVQSSIALNASVTATADIYVGPPESGANITAIGVYDAGATTVAYGPSAVEIYRGTTKEMLVAGDGVSAANGSTLTISGGGVTVSNVRYQGSGSSALIFVTLNISPSAAPGPRNVMITNSNLDTSVLTGGVFIR